MKSGEYNEKLKNGLLATKMCFLGCYSGLQHCNYERAGNCAKDDECPLQESPYPDDADILDMKEKSCDNCGYNKFVEKMGEECRFYRELYCKDENHPFLFWLEEEPLVPPFTYEPISDTYELFLGKISENNYTKISICKRGIEVSAYNGKAYSNFVCNIDWDYCTWKPHGWDKFKSDKK